MNSSTATAAETGRFYGWISLTMGGFVMFISLGTFSTVQVFVPILCKEFGWSRALVGGAGSVAMILMGLAAPLSGVIIGKYGIKPAIIIGNGLMSVALACLFFQSQPWHLFLAGGVILGLGTGIAQLVPPTIANNWFIKKRSMALSLMMSSGSMGAFVLIPITTAVIAGFGWRGAYLFLAAGVIICAIILPGILIKEKPEDIGQVPDGIPVMDSNEDNPDKPRREIYTTPVDFTFVEAVRTRSLWLLIYLIVTIMFVTSMLSIHQIAYLESLGITEMVAATAAGLMAGIGVVGALGIGALGLRFNMWPLTICCIVVTVIGMGILLTAKTLPMVFLYNILLGAGMGAFMTGFLTNLSAYYGRTNFAQIIGFTGPFATLLGGSGALFAGAMYDATGSYRMPFIVGACLMLSALLAVFLCSPPKHPSLKE